MSRMMTRAGIAAAALCLSTIAALADITGDYFAAGRNPDGSAYGGTTRISQNADGTYTVFWSVGSEYSGIGMLAGQVFTVQWGDTYPAVYVVMPDGDLHGTWADGRGLEQMSRTPLN